MNIKYIILGLLMMASTAMFGQCFMVTLIAEACIRDASGTITYTVDGVEQEVWLQFNNIGDQQKLGVYNSDMEIEIKEIISDCPIDLDIPDPTPWIRDCITVNVIESYPNTNVRTEVIAQTRIETVTETITDTLYQYVILSDCEDVEECKDMFPERILDGDYFKAKDSILKFTIYDTKGIEIYEGTSWDTSRFPSGLYIWKHKTCVGKIVSQRT